MAEMVPEESNGSTGLASATEHDSNNHSSGPVDYQLSSPTTHENESKGQFINPSTSNGNKVRSEPADWVVQDEPGVYITLSSLAGGGKNLKRIRFSRKRFSEKEAEEWWAANRAQVFKRHDIRTAFKSDNETLSVPANESTPN